MNLSIIIPVYNVTKTLRRCVESVLRQQIRDYEVILVDDGATDGSAELCDQLAKEDNHIRVVHQKNQGLSAARNTGIAKSHGRYITFVDSDDYLADGTLNDLMTILRVHPEYDILEYPAILFYGSKKQKRLNLLPRCYSNLYEYWIGSGAYTHSYACNKVFKAELFQQVKFPVGRRFEDSFVMPQLVSQACNVATTSKGQYYYTYNPEGITAKATGNDLNDLLEAHLIYIYMYAGEYDSTSAAFSRYYAHVLNIQIDVYEQTGQTPRLPDMRVMPLTMKLRIANLIGVKKTCQLSKSIHKLIRRSH